MAKFSDFSIKKQQDAMLERLAKVLKRYEGLDDAEKVLRANPKELREAIKTYGKDLGFLKDYFTGNVVNILVADSARQLEKGLNQFKEYENYKMSKATKQKIINEIKREYGTQVSLIIDELVTKQAAKSFQYRALVEMQAIPTARQVEQFKRVGNVIDINGKKVSTGTAQETWDLMTKRYGQYDKIIFAPRTSLATGKVIQHKMFLNNYIEGKSVTMSQEGHTATTQVMGAQTGISTATIPPNGTKDSCILHERNIFFLTGADKKLFIKQYGKEFPQSKTWLTLQEVRDDKTHMLKWNCRHVVTLLPVQYLPDSKQEKLPASKSIPDNRKEITKQTDQDIEARKVA